MYKSIVVMAAVLMGFCHNIQASSVIPRPLTETAVPSGDFVLSPRTVISYDRSLLPQAEYLCGVFAGSTGWDLSLREGHKGHIRLVVDSAAVPSPEGYTLQVTPKAVTITGHDAAGVFYGIQTLLQYLPAEIYGDIRRPGMRWSVPAVTVADAPAHPWRGMMLDAARYYYDKDYVKKFIDMMAMYKLNKLQFHFIDDCGWRLESKKYPRLTEVGAWSGQGAQRKGGFYTHEDIREIVEYAAVRGVEIIPEIEFPAHILSAVVAYPWLSCTGVQHEVPEQHFISRDLLCVGKESSLRFLRDILDETVELFPSRYINIGGDEAVYSRWAECPDCQALMRREGLSKPSDLQGWLTDKVAGWMKQRGRTVVGWEEIIMRGEVSTPVVALIWHNPQDSVVATSAGHQAVLTPASHLYFDFPESSVAGEPQHATWMPPVSLRKAYEMPVNDYSDGSLVLGVQGCIWSDQFIHGTRLQDLPFLNENRSERYVEYFVFPRLSCLVGKLCMGPPSLQRSYDDFRSRLGSHFPRLDAKGCNYRVPEPEVSEATGADGRVTFTVTPNVEGADIHYTVDGTYPNFRSAHYTGPVTVDHRSDFMAVNVVAPGHQSLPFMIQPDYSEYADLGTYTVSWRPLTVQTSPAPWKFECTGKITSNGTWQVSFVKQRGEHDLVLKDMRLFKRDGQIARAEQKSSSSFILTVDDFEAGTPFFIEVTAHGDGGNDSAGLVFIKKLD